MASGKCKIDKLSAKCLLLTAGNYVKRRIHTRAFLVIPNIQMTSDDVVVRGTRRLLLEQILKRDAVEIAADDAL